jgi:urease accessory protein
VPIQILRTSLRLRRDPAMRALLSKFAVKMAEIEAPFDPEGGAYAAVVGDHHHDHGHHHQHGHHHDDHDHGTKKSFS